MDDESKWSVTMTYKVEVVAVLRGVTDLHAFWSYLPAPFTQDAEAMSPAADARFEVGVALGANSGLLNQSHGGKSYANLPHYNDDYE